MKEFIDDRFGRRGQGFIFYALGPIFFGALFFYFVRLIYIASNNNSGTANGILFTAAAVIIGVFFILDVLVIYEATKTIRKASIANNVVSLKPYLGRAFRVGIKDITRIKSRRSFGFIPGISMIDNNRSNIEIYVKGKKSFYLFGSCEADDFVLCLKGLIE